MKGMFDFPRRYSLPLFAVATGISLVLMRWPMAAPKSPLDSAAPRPSVSSLPEEPQIGCWPNLFGPTHNSRSPEEGLVFEWPDEGPPVAWRKSIGTGYGAPIIVGDDGIVFHRLGDREIVECFRIESGETRWRHEDAATFDCPVAYSDGPYSTPTTNDRCVYVIGAAGVVRCLDQQSGELRWRRDLHADYDVPADQFGVPASPLIEGGLLVVNLGGRPGAGILALDCTTGATRWTATEHGAGYATPTPATIHGRRYVFVFTRDGLVALTPADGSVCWNVPFRASNPEHVNATSPLVEGDIVLVSGYSLGNLAVRILPDGGYEELWRDKRRVLDSQYNNLVAGNGCVFGFASADNSLRCVDLATGDLRWRYKSDLGRGSALAVDGRLLVVGEYGLLAVLALDATEARPLTFTASPIFSSRGFTAPALAGGRLLVRADTELVCVDLRPR